MFKYKQIKYFFVNIWEGIVKNISRPFSMGNTYMTYVLKNKMYLKEIPKTEKIIKIKIGKQIAIQTAYTYTYLSK